jgi:single-strand DNA-binding protein
MFNKIILVGNLTRDVELKYTQGGTAVASTAIATSRKFKAQDGTQKEEVCFVDITFFGRTAEIANQFLKRGSKVLLDGKLKLDNWTDQNGNKRSKHSISVESMQMLGNKEENQTSSQQDEPYSYAQQNEQKPEPKVEVMPNSIEDDYIPF